MNKKSSRHVYLRISNRTVFRKKQWASATVSSGWISHLPWEVANSHCWRIRRAKFAVCNTRKLEDRNTTKWCETPPCSLKRLSTEEALYQNTNTLYLVGSQFTDQSSEHPMLHLRAEDKRVGCTGAR